MARITIVFGLILIALGVIGYVPTSAPTALIPAGFGILLVLFGALALKEGLRMHAMHGAVLIGLIGFIGAVARIVPAAIKGTIELPLAFGMQVGMAVVCAVFVGLCVKSFVDARRNRKAAPDANLPNEMKLN